MSKKEKYFNLVCDMVQQAYTEAKLNALCGKKENYDDSLVKEHLDILRKLIEKSDAKGDSK